MHRVVKPRLAICAVVAALVASGCGPDAQSSGPPVQTGARAGAVFDAALTLGGEVNLRGTFSDHVTSRGETCGAYVAGLLPATTLWVVPTPGNATIVGGHIVTYTAGVPSSKPSTGYHGPATYAQPSAVVADLVIDNDSFVGGDSATATIAVRADGSGSMRFAGLVDTATDAAESGSETWTCAG